MYTKRRDGYTDGVTWCEKYTHAITRPEVGIHVPLVQNTNQSRREVAFHRTILKTVNQSQKRRWVATQWPSFKMSTNQKTVATLPAKQKQPEDCGDVTRETKKKQKVTSHRVTSCVIQGLSTHHWHSSTSGTVPSFFGRSLLGISVWGQNAVVKKDKKHQPTGKLQAGYHF